MDKKRIIQKALIDKRNEIIVSLYHYQEYTYTDIAYIFKLAHTTVLRIIKNHGVV
jgi:DNA-directed RNA polymerase specialized sigma subunit